MSTVACGRLVRFFLLPAVVNLPWPVLLTTPPACSCCCGSWNEARRGAREVARRKKRRLGLHKDTGRKVVDTRTATPTTYEAPCNAAHFGRRGTHSRHSQVAVKTNKAAVCALFQPVSGEGGAHRHPAKLHMATLRQADLSHSHQKTRISAESSWRAGRPKAPAMLCCDFRRDESGKDGGRQQERERKGGRRLSRDRERQRRTCGSRKLVGVIQASLRVSHRWGRQVCIHLD
ncbi:hypothetical protein O3P69_014798 [Scylla paramamosain]|uniref:Secreted protein n=1 Tax=Scylla paramamosain TaxID=85552 RepID=A0AAW0TZK7_SCYPA